jgi:hypothetical protein
MPGAVTYLRDPLMPYEMRDECPDAQAEVMTANERRVAASNNVDVFANEDLELTAYYWPEAIATVGRGCVESVASW